MATAYHNLSEYDFNSVPNAEAMKFGIVVSEWNFNITGALLKGAVDTLKKHGAKDENILVKTVPGSFELTFGANQMMENCDLDAIIAIGCVIKGDTPHFDYVCMGSHSRNYRIKRNWRYTSYLRINYHKYNGASRGSCRWQTG